MWLPPVLAGRTGTTEDDMATKTTKLVFTTTAKGTRIHKDSCRYAKTAAPVDRLAVLDAAKLATCCRPKAVDVDAVRATLTKKEAAAAKARKPATKAAPKKRTPKAAPTESRRVKPSTKETKLFAAKRTLADDQMVPEGARWFRRNRLGSLVASVDLRQANGDDGEAFRWGSVCVTHGTTVRHRTHRDAWKVLPRSADWCDGCREGA